MRSGWLLLPLVLALGCKGTTAVPVADESSVISDDDGVFETKTGDEIGDLFGQVMRSRGTPVKRAVFLKPHGCSTATFDIAADLPAKYKVGLFATPGQHK